jgi:hypothetical protein
VVAKRRAGPGARRPGRRHGGRRPRAHPGRRPRRPGPARGPRRPRRGAVTRPGRRPSRPRPGPDICKTVHSRRPRPPPTPPPIASCSPPRQPRPGKHRTTGNQARAPCTARNRIGRAARQRLPGAFKGSRTSHGIRPCRDTGHSSAGHRAWQCPDRRPRAYPPIWSATWSPAWRRGTRPNGRSARAAARGSHQARLLINARRPVWSAWADHGLQCMLAAGHLLAQIDNTQRGST